MKLLIGFIVLCFSFSPTLQQDNAASKEAVAEDTVEGSGDITTVKVDIENVGFEEPDFEVDIEASTEDENEEEEEESDIVEVKTFLGRIKGKKTILENGDEMHKYLGIPYAQAPIGQLRFKPPKVVTRYKDQECFDFGAECPQLPFGNPNSQEVKGSEDCLFLNVFTIPAPENSTVLKPVMVWIHGGGFTLGSGQIYDPTPLVQEGVIVVTINYRLAGLGFLTFGDDIVPGNMGLRDQVEAIKWTKRFIYYFGGDPSRITIFGESAGAVSVNALQMSPMSTGLISGAIAQSGTVFLSAINRESRPERIAPIIGAKFNCTNLYGNTRLLKCLQQVPMADFVLNTQSEELSLELNDFEIGTIWAPVQDSYSSDPVLPMDGLEAYLSGDFNKVPMMTGTVKNDGALFFPEEEILTRWNSIGSNFLLIAESRNYSEVKPEEVTLANVLLQYYTCGTKTSFFDALDEFVNMMTDAWFLSPDQKLAELASRHTQVYNYQLTYSGSTSFIPFFIAGKNLSQERTSRLAKLSPVHADDTLYLFNLFGARNDDDLRVSATMVKYWTNFAKYGHPSPFMNENLTLWKHYSGDRRYMELDLEPQLKQNLEAERMMLWQRMVWDNRERKLEKPSMMNKLAKTVLNFLRSSVL